MMELFNLSDIRKASGAIAPFRQSEIFASVSGTYIGKTKTYGLPYFLDTDDALNGHMTILGTTGSGKTYFLKSYVTRQSLKRDCSLLIMDWNGEYNDLLEYLDGRIVDLGGKDTVNVLELLLKPNTISLESFCNLTANIIGLDGNETALLQNKIASALSDQTGKLLKISKIIESIKDDESDYAKTLKTKLQPLKLSKIFEGKTSFETEEILNSTLSVCMGKLKNDLERRFVTSIIVEIAISIMHSMPINSAKRRIVVLDEVWRTLGNKNNLGQLFREGRKYGISLIIASQLSRDISKDMFSNSATIVTFKLQNNEDIAALIDNGIVGEDEAKRIASLSIGSCIIQTSLKFASTPSRIFIRIVDGIELGLYVVESDKMRLKIADKEFVKTTEKCVRDASIRAKLMAFASANSKKLELVSFVTFLRSENLSRGEVVGYLRMLGVSDMDILHACNEGAIKHGDTR